MTMKLITFLLLVYVARASSLLPPRFQWKSIDYAWKDEKARNSAMNSGDYIPENNMPSGLARWRNKLFIVVPRWKKGVVSSLNYINVNGPETQPLRPYPSWADGYVSDHGKRKPRLASVISAFRVHVDEMDRLWVVDNGVSDMSGEVKELAPPAIVVFDLHNDKLIRRYDLPKEIFTSSTVLSSITVEVPTGKKADPLDTFAYITDMGSNSIIVYSMKNNTAWRFEHELFHADPTAGEYKVGGVDFYWHDGVSSAILAPAAAKKEKLSHDLYFHATSSFKLFRISTGLLKDRNASKKQISDGIQVVGDRGFRSQASALDYDHVNKVIFYTQLSKNGVGCWNIEKPYAKENTPLILSDCGILEFPNDIKVDDQGNLWILSDRQSRFLYGNMDFSEINFRILTAPTKKVIEGTQCEKNAKKLKSSSNTFAKCVMNSSCSAAHIR